MQDHVDMSVELIDELLLVRLDGEIDMANADRIGRRVVHDVLEREPTGPAVVLDLAGLSYLDSSGLRMLEEVRHALAQHGLRMFTVAPETCRAHRLLSLTGLLEHLGTVADMAAVQVELAGESEPSV
jgi:anti-sigma B factor antagonist